MKLKEFKVTIQSIICDCVTTEIIRTFDTRSTIYALDRNGAMRTGLDMAQAMARGMIATQGQYTQFFKIVEIKQQDQKG